MRDVLLSFVIAIAGGGGSCSDGRGLVAEGFRAGAHPSGFRYQRFVQCAHQHLIESHASSSRWAGSADHLSGTIFRGDGITPAAGITLFLYQTDAGGFYLRPQEDVLRPTLPASYARQRMGTTKFIPSNRKWRCWRAMELRHRHPFALRHWREILREGLQPEPAEPAVGLRSARPSLWGVRCRTRSSDGPKAVQHVKIRSAARRWWWGPDRSS